MAFESGGRIGLAERHAVNGSALGGTSMNRDVRILVWGGATAV